MNHSYPIRTRRSKMSKHTKKTKQSQRRNTRKACVRSFSSLMSPRNASLFCHNAWSRQ